MKIAIIGTGNIGGSLATKWALKGHTILLGVKNLSQFKGKNLLKNPNTSVLSIAEAVLMAEVVLVATPSTAVLELLPQLGNVKGKVLIDSSNSIRQSPDPYKTLYHCLAENTNGEIVKCFNITGFENIINPIYQGVGIDMFMAGDSDRAKQVVSQLSLDAGFGSCIDFGKSDKVELLEKFALCWINLAIMQEQGRGIAFKLVRR